MNLQVSPSKSLLARLAIFSSSASGLKACVFGNASGSLRSDALSYVDTRKEVDDVDQLAVLADEDAANKWFEENDPEGVTCEVIGRATPT
jgi:hypothetical protein